MRCDAEEPLRSSWLPPDPSHLQCECAHTVGEHEGQRSQPLRTGPVCARNGMVPLDSRLATSSGRPRHYAFARFWNDTAATERPRTEESSICSLSDQANRTPSVILVAAMEANPQKGLSTPCRHTSGSPHHRSKGEERLQSFWPVGWKIWPEDRASRSPEAKMAHPARLLRSSF